jgi:hypothetical protein
MRTEKHPILIWGEIMQHPDYDAWWKAHNTKWVDCLMQKIASAHGTCIGQ